MEDYKKAYEQLLRDNTRLHAEKKQILDAGQRGLERAQKEIEKLHTILRSVADKSAEIVKDHFEDSNTRDQALREIYGLKPLQIQADGTQRPGT